MGEERKGRPFGYSWQVLIRPFKTGHRRSWGKDSCKHFLSAYYMPDSGESEKEQKEKRVEQTAAPRNKGSRSCGKHAEVAVEVLDALPCPP